MWIVMQRLLRGHFARKACAWSSYTPRLSGTSSAFMASVGACFTAEASVVLELGGDSWADRSTLEVSQHQQDFEEKDMHAAPPEKDRHSYLSGVTDLF